MGFLPGIGGLMGAAKLFNISLRTSAHAADNTVNIPSVSSGELILCFEYARNRTTMGSVLSGFTQLAVSDDGDRACRASAKIAVGTEGGTAFTGVSGLDPERLVVVFEGNVPIVGFTGAHSAQATDGNPSNQAVNGASGAAPQLQYGAMLSNGTSAFTTEPTWTGTLNPNTNTLFGYLIYNVPSSPANNNVDCGDVGSQGLMSGYLNFT